MKCESTRSDSQIRLRAGYKAVRIWAYGMVVFNIAVVQNEFVYEVWIYQIRLTTPPSPIL